MKPLEPKGLWLQFAAQRLRRFAEFNRNGKACCCGTPLSPSLSPPSRRGGCQKGEG
jgi:hypothetical protein